MPRGDLTDTQGERLRPRLPPQKPQTGRPAVDPRRILDGLVWILRTGAPWPELPERYGPWRTVASRCYRWRKAGAFQHLVETLKPQADAAGQLDGDVPFLDSTMIRAHQHAAGAKTGLPRPTRSGGAEAASARQSTSGRQGPARSSRGC